MLPATFGPPLIKDIKVFSFFGCFVTDALWRFGASSHRSPGFALAHLACLTHTKLKFGIPLNV